MQIRWTFVIFIAVLALGLTAFINRRTAAAATPQAATSVAKTPALAKNAKSGAPAEI